MAYDDNFYNAYKAYLIEPAVRKAHNHIFEIANLDKNFKDVVDFGCGAFNEFFVYVKPLEYVGLDVNVSPEEGESRRLIPADYRKSEDLISIIQPNWPTAFVSLFSTEITAPHAENYALYEKIFNQLPTIKAGLVSGFYYENRKNQNPVGEAGELMSYQTLESIEDVKSKVFEEERIILPVPSNMFGADVFEVWKFFARK
jgi:hypothetical protein